MHHPTPETIRAALLLTNRLVPLGAKPLAAKEFWQLVEQVDPGELLDLDADDIADRVRAEPDEGRRLRTLLDAATAMSFEQERLHDGGVALVSALDERFPATLRERLGAGCPPFLLCAGSIEQLGGGGLAIVGSGEPTSAALDIARTAATLAAGHGWSVITGLEPGIEFEATLSAVAAGGSAIGVPPDGILRASRRAEIRKQVHAGSLSLLSPYAPDAAFRASNARGRDKIVHALSSLAFVVSADEGQHGAWTGATESLEQRIAPVAVWTGDGAPDGNHALVRHGAKPVSRPDELFDLDLTIEPPEQSSLF
jgi:predicted Rossmann fold nucleotide-binding protein DprA/Smf involved in DNA uptake